MSAGGEVVVTLSVNGLPESAHRVLVRPGLTQTVQLLALVDGHPSRIELAVRVAGSVCPDPAAHVRDCDETRYDLLGDCDGDVREYRVHDAGVAGKQADDTVLLCAAHAQMNGSRIRRITR